MSTKYLDSTGLAYFWDKIKDYVDSHGGGGGDIVESGTSGIWKYRKWTDGTAECWGRTAAKNYAVTSPYVNGWYANLDQITFPSGLFVDAPIVNATRAETGSGAALLFPSLHTVTSTGFKGFIGSVSSGTYSVSLSIMAKGRWK